MPLCCPLCREPLTPAGASYRCPRGHSFDRAREGYLSLLHGRQKGEGRGDTKAMILARDRAHRAGVFEPLAAALAALPLPPALPTALELGCGEGFFLEHLTRTRRVARSYGLDLSVDAVKLAARTLRHSLLLRADLLQPLPFADESLDLIQSIFAPRPLAEVRRTLRPGGCAVFVHPLADHWHELRAFLPLAGIGEEKLPAAELAGFKAITAQTIVDKRTLTHSLACDLVEMSPSIHRLTRELATWRTLLPASLTATLSVRVILVRKF